MTLAICDDSIGSLVNLSLPPRFRGSTTSAIIAFTTECGSRKLELFLGSLGLPIPEIEWLS